MLLLSIGVSPSQRIHGHMTCCMHLIFSLIIKVVDRRVVFWKIFCLRWIELFDLR